MYPKKKKEKETKRSGVYGTARTKKDKLYDEHQRRKTTGGVLEKTKTNHKRNVIEEKRQETCWVGKHRINAKGKIKEPQIVGNSSEIVDTRS